MSIQPLPEDVVAQIKSSTAITSLNSAAYGLLQNSLDAGSSRINISVDYSRGNCSVEDNGLGINPASFHEDGGLGRRHYTSKYPARPDCHGKHGDFLASLGSLSLLSIASHHRDYRSHNSLTIHNCRVVSRNLPAPPEQRVLAFPNGTRVVVRDLFGSMPVRVKQRAIEVERGGTSRDFDQLLFSTVGLLLPWHGEVTVSLQDAHARRTVSLHASHAIDWTHSQLKTAPEMLSKTTTLLSESSMIENEDLKSWVPIGATASGVSVRGCVCLQPVATKRVQFIAVGIQPLLNERHSNVFYEDVNRVFQDSRFGVVEEPILDEDGEPTKTQGFTGKELKPKRGLERWPMFFLQVMLNTGTESLDVDDFLDGRLQNVAVISDLLQVMAYEFLKKHHFRPKSISAIERLKRPMSNSHDPRSQLSRASSSTQLRDQTGSPLQRSRVRSQVSTQHGRRQISEKRLASPFAAWSRTKSSAQDDSGAKDSPVYHGSPEPTPAQDEPWTERHRAPTVPLTCSGTDNRLFHRAGALLRKPFDDADESPATSRSNTPKRLLSDEQLHQTATERETVLWVDPITKIKSLIDPRPGFAVKSQAADHNKKTPIPILRKRSHDAGRLRWQPTPTGEQNSIFQLSELRIPTVLQASETFGCEDHRKRHDAVEGGHTQNMMTTLEGRISKTHLQNAEILGQVDQKFILVKVSTEPPASSGDPVSQAESLLVLIDQHAADERCKVEGLLKTYFVSDPMGGGQYMAKTQILDKPLRFDLSRQDGELLIRFRAHFKHWGIGYDGSSDEPTLTKGTTVEVQSLPPAIMERCRLEPRLLVDLLRKEIWKLHAAGSSGTRSSPRAGAQADWVARFHDCPDGILELLNSRACRSAIMFNDPLTSDQCRDLVERLAACAFPFQCAHGRPSMVPLVHLGQDDGLGSSGVDAGGGGGELLGDLKRWKQSFNKE